MHSSIRSLVHLLCPMPLDISSSWNQTGFLFIYMIGRPRGKESTEVRITQNKGKETENSHRKLKSWTGTRIHTRKQNRNMWRHPCRVAHIHSLYSDWGRPCPSKYFDFVSVCVFVCLSTVNSSIFGGSSRFPFPYFIWYASLT